MIENQEIKNQEFEFKRMEFKWRQMRFLFAYSTIMVFGVLVTYFAYYAWQQDKYSNEYAISASKEIRYVTEKLENNNAKLLNEVSSLKERQLQLEELVSILRENQKVQSQLLEKLSKNKGE